MNTKQQKIPNGWRTIELQSVGDFSKGRGISKAQLANSGLNAIRYGELYTRHNFKIKKIYSFISNKTALLSKKITQGDIIFAGSGETIDEIGKSATYLNSEDCYVGGDTIIFSPKNQNSLFLSYFLNIGISRRELRKLGQGQSVVHIYKKDLEKLKLLLPPLPEQNSIVEVLKTWDEYLEEFQKKIEIKKKIKKGLMQQLLTGKKRLKGFNGKWKEAKIEDVCEIKKGNGLSKKKLTKDGLNKCILYGEIYTTYSEVIKNVISKTNFNEGSKSKKEDVLIPSSTTTSAIDLATATTIQEDNVLLGGDINVIRSKKNDINGIYFSHYLTHIKKIEMAKLAQGITIVHLYGKDIKKLKIDLPSIEEQTAIANILTTADEEIEVLNKQKEKVEAQKKYLLNNLITGKIRVPKHE